MPAGTPLSLSRPLARRRDDLLDRPAADRCKSEPEPVDHFTGCQLEAATVLLALRVVFQTRGELQGPGRDLAVGVRHIRLGMDLGQVRMAMRALGNAVLLAPLVASGEG